MVAALIAASACDMTGIPRVAGTYTGTMTVSGSVAYQGYTWGFPPAMSGTVDATGAFTAEGVAGGMVAAFSPTTSSSPCGTIGGALFTLTFSGSEADFNLAAQTSRCGLVSYHSTLTR